MLAFRKAILFGIAFLATTSGGQAAEGGASSYLLGLRGPGAGITPPPGVFFSNQFYFYNGDISANIQFANGDVAGSAEATGIIDLAAAQWVTPWELFGGSLGFSLLVPFGHVDIDANVISPLIGETGDDVFTYGDPNLTAFLGWQNGNFHLQTGVTAFIPIGDYQEGELANVAKHRWAADLYSALTWFDPATGIDITNVVGITFNGENEVTDYQTGTEFHWEWGVSKKFNPHFKAGFIGYYYNQLTADSGSGVSPLLGDFKGEVAAVGGMLGYDFMAGQIPVSTQLRYYHEFEAKNRLEGDAVFFQVSMPLWVQQ